MRGFRLARLLPQMVLIYCCAGKHCEITDIRATTVTVPLEAPLRHANGVHWGRFVRTIVEVETDNGLIGLGEMGGGGESAEATFRAMKAYLVGHDPSRLEEMRFLIANPTASLYNNRTQIHAALEFACLDILGQAWGVPVCDILGGRVRDSVRFASYCFFRYPNPKTKAGEVRTIDQLVGHARELKKRFGFTTHKMKGGVFHPDYELEAYRALAAAFPGDSLRFDPNAVWSTEQAIRFGQAIEGLNNDYLEDPVYGLNGMRRTREKVRVPLATKYRCCEFRTARGECFEHSRRCHPSRYDILGRYSCLRESRRCVRDVSIGNCRSFVGRTRNPTRDDAAHGRRPFPDFHSPATRTTTTSPTTSSSAA